MDINFQNILDHYKDPHNFGQPSWKPTHSYKLLNTTCGDEIEIFLLIKNSSIRKAAFIGDGCSIAIGSASILTELLKDKPTNVILNLSLDDYINNHLHIKLTPSRVKCATLSLECAKSGISLS